jgi:chemotaxis protein MotB
MSSKEDPMRQLVILAVSVATLSGCGVSQQEHAALESETNKYKQALQEQSSKTAALEQKNAALEAQLNSLQQQSRATTGQKSLLEAKTARLQAETGELKERQASVLNTQILFPEKSSKLTPEVKRSLDTVVEAIAQLRDKAVIVAAYTDDVEGKDAAKRWQLSSARASEVAKYMVSRGLDSSMIAVAGFGESRPVAPNDSIANRALNRRAEVVLTPPELRMKTVEVNPATLNK